MASEPQTITRQIERLLNLQGGDLRRGGLLFCYLFFVISTYVIGKSARAALFLSQFPASKIPYAEIAITAAVGPVAAGYVFLSRRGTLRNLQLGVLLFFFSNCALFWYLAVSPVHPVWLYPAFYIWVGVMGVVGPAQVWTIANFVLTTREAKRVFGLLGSGAIVGGIVAGLLTNVVARRFHTESLLLVMTLFMALSAGLVLVIWREKHAALGEPVEEEGATKQDRSINLRESLKLIASSRYLLAICAVICVCSLVTASARWQFQAIAKEFKPNKDVLAAFFGAFDFYAGLAGLATQLLLTGRILRRFGIGMALFVLPVWLLLGTTGVLVWGSLLAVSTMRGGDQILRYSIDKSSVELLFLPIPANVKVQVKSFIDVVVWRFGDGLSGITLAIFADQLKWTAQRIGWINLVYIGAWVAAALVARRQYVATLRESIQQHRLDAERASAQVLDRSAVDLLVDQFQATDPQKILYALSLLEAQHRQATHPAVRGLLGHPAPEVRQKAIAILNAAGDKAVAPQVEQLLRDPHLEVRTEALLYLGRHTHMDPLELLQELGDFEDFSIRSAMVAYLAHSGPAQNLVAAGVLLEKMANETGPQGKRDRLEAARLIARIPDHFNEQHRLLLTDPDPQVAAEAIRAVGQLRKRRFVMLLLDRIAEPELTPAVVEALAQFGDAAVGTLRDHLNDPEIPIESRREIPAVLARLGTPEAAHVLNELLLESDTQFRFRTISALNKIYQAHPEVERDTQMIETVLAAEIMGHYRSYQILGTLGDDIPKDDAISSALRESMDHEVERIFRLLGLLYPRYDLHSACFGVQSSNAIVHDNALEFLDNVLQPQLRNILVPLLDSCVTIAERVKLANRLVGAKVQSREEAVAALVLSEDPWLKSCGAYAVGTLGLKALEAELDRCMEHPDPLLRETARQAKLRLANLGQPV